MADVKWIKLNVGMFDGNSFKKIKKAKIGGESFRDKLTAVWFELMDFAGKCNAGGQLIESPEIPFSSIEDIAILIDREPEELSLCMNYYINNRMIVVIDDIYMLANWSKYQNIEGMDRIREQNRKRVAKHRQNQKLLGCNVTSNVTVTECNAIDKEIEKEIDKEIDKEGEESATSHPSPKQIVDLFNSICVSFPSVRSLSEARRKAIKARLNTYTIDEFKAMFEMAEASPFLKGQGDRNWRANFDWLIKDSNFAKVLDGNYSDKKTGATYGANRISIDPSKTDLDDLF